MSTYCSYCSDGPYKEHLIIPPEFIGGYIDDYWFCQQCIEFGLSSSTDNERQRIQRLKKIAEKNSTSNKIIDH